MEIQVGKKYLNRAGECKTIVKSDNDTPKNRVVFDNEGAAYWAISGLRQRGAETPHDLVAEFQESPIREITKREIVPGVYGLVEIFDETGNGFVRIRLGREVFNANELDAAASVLTQIAAVMRENSNGK